MIPEEIKNKIEDYAVKESSSPSDAWFISKHVQVGYSLAMEAYASQQQCGLRWVTSNESRPLKDGFYYTTDSVGNKTMVHFYNDHWHSLTGHPVVKWLDEQSPCLLEKEIAVSEQRSKELVEALAKILSVQEDDFNVANFSPIDMVVLINVIAQTALNNYKAKP